MATTSAQRQAQYRQRRAESGENGERRISMWVSTAAALALKRLARHNGITQRQVIEMFVIAADERIMRDLDDARMNAYLDVTP